MEVELVGAAVRRHESDGESRSKTSRVIVSRPKPVHQLMLVTPSAGLNGRRFPTCGPGSGAANPPFARLPCECRPIA